jgi:hypothetical protein
MTTRTVLLAYLRLLLVVGDRSRWLAPICFLTTLLLRGETGTLHYRLGFPARLGAIFFLSIYECYDAMSYLRLKH